METFHGEDSSDESEDFEDDVEIDISKLVDKNGYRKNTNIFSKAKCKKLNKVVDIGDCMQINVIKKSTLDTMKAVHANHPTPKRAEAIYITYLLYTKIKLFRGGLEVKMTPLFFEKIIVPYYYSAIRDIYVYAIMTHGVYFYDIIKIKVYDSVLKKFYTYSVPKSTDLNDGDVMLVINKNDKTIDMKFRRKEDKTVQIKNNQIEFDENTRCIVHKYPTTDIDNLEDFINGDKTEMKLSIPLQCEAKPLVRFVKYLSDKNEYNSNLQKTSKKVKIIVQNKAPLKDEEMKNFISIYNNTKIENKPVNMYQFGGLDNFEKDNGVYTAINQELNNCDPIQRVPIQNTINKEIEMDKNGMDIFSMFQRAKNDGYGIYVPPRIVGDNEIYEISPFQEYKGVLDGHMQSIDTIPYENFVNSKYCETYNMPEISRVNRLVSTAEINSENKISEKYGDTLKLIIGPLFDKIFNTIYPDKEGIGEFSIEFQTTPEYDMATLIELYERGLLGDDYMKTIIERVLDPGFEIDRFGKKDETTKKRKKEDTDDSDETPNKIRKEKKDIVKKRKREEDDNEKEKKKKDE